MKLHITKSGPMVATDGRALVFIHAYPIHSGLWRNQLASLGSTYPCIAVDLRGFGQSTNYPDEPFTIQRYGQDVLETLDAEGVKSAVVAGCSMGGYTMFELLRQDPARLAGLIFCDTRADADTDETRAKRQQQIEKVQQAGTAWLGDFVLETQLAASTRLNQPDLAAEISRWAAAASAGSVVRALQMLADRPDSRPQLAAVQVPTSFVVGAEDQVTPQALSEVMHRQVPGSRLEVIPAAGHLAPLENPDPVTAAIKAVAALAWAE